MFSGMFLFKTSWQIQQTVVFHQQYIYIAVCLLLLPSLLLSWWSCCSEEPSLHFFHDRKNCSHNKQQPEKLCSRLDLETSWAGLDWLSPWNNRLPQEVHKWTQVTAIYVVLIFLTWFYKNYPKWAVFHGHKELANFSKTKHQWAGLDANLCVTNRLSDPAKAASARYRLGTWQCVVKLLCTPCSSASTTGIPSTGGNPHSKELNHRSASQTPHLQAHVLLPSSNSCLTERRSAVHHSWLWNSLQDSDLDVLKTVLSLLKSEISLKDLHLLHTC